MITTVSGSQTISSFDNKNLAMRDIFGDEATWRHDGLVAILQHGSSPLMDTFSALTTTAEEKTTAIHDLRREMQELTASFKTLKKEAQEAERNANEETTKMKKDLEAERKQRKKDLEAGRKQRKEAERTANEEITKTRKDLEAKNRELREELGREREERLQSGEVVTELTTALQAAILNKDLRPLQQIHLRAALDRAQSLAEQAIAKDPVPASTYLHTTYSKRWRDRFIGMSTQARVRHANALLANIPAFNNIVCSPNALATLCEGSSTVRSDGDHSAHPYLSTRSEVEVLQRVVPGMAWSDATKDGMETLLSFVSASLPS
ncbi:hypothetical protein NLJ89_g10595 [Agrocybe chaxingu]|uniref:Uncharacterized protein n=1 Tax=Agrocybe chaxingu TaxID=84603 RepID=A0A9W8JRF8_9AGAR|nr:hypothetical protein NLJ89_g10595 [Agrocybe chaxingu]